MTVECRRRSKLSEAISLNASARLRARLRSALQILAPHHAEMLWQARRTPPINRTPREIASSEIKRASRGAGRPARGEERVVPTRNISLAIVNDRFELEGRRTTLPSPQAFAGRIVLIGSGRVAARAASLHEQTDRQIHVLDLDECAQDDQADSTALRPDLVRSLVSSAHVVIVHVADATRACEILQHQVFPVAARGTLVLSASSMTIETAQALAAAADAMGLRFADAPIPESAGLPGEEGATIHVGCNPADFPQVSAVLAPVARFVRYVGAAGAGQASESCRNLVLAATTMVVSEALMLADRLGLDAVEALEIAVGAATQACRPRRCAPGPASLAAVSTDEMLLDLKRTQRAAARVGTSLPVVATAQEIYTLFARLGGGGKPFTSVGDMLRGAGERRSLA